MKRKKKKKEKGGKYVKKKISQSWKGHMSNQTQMAHRKLKKTN